MISTGVLITIRRQPPLVCHSPENNKRKFLANICVGRVGGCVLTSATHVFVFSLVFFRLVFYAVCVSPFCLFAGSCFFWPGLFAGFFRQGLSGSDYQLGFLFQHHGEGRGGLGPQRLRSVRV